MRLVVVLFVAVAVGAAFARGGSAPGRGTATLTGGGRTVTLRVELARTRVGRQPGLRHRRSLAADAGMAFLYAERSVAYRGVLEVNAGAFARWGIRAGDRITVRSRSA